MTCVNCSNGIEKVVNKMEGLDTSKVNFTANSGEFVIDNEKLDKTKLIAKIKKLGYGVEEDIEALEKAKKESYNKLKALFFVAASFSFYIFVFMLFPLTMVNNNYIIFALATKPQKLRYECTCCLGYKCCLLLLYRCCTLSRYIS